MGVFLSVFVFVGFEWDMWFFGFNGCLIIGFISCFWMVFVF